MKCQMTEEVCGTRLDLRRDLHADLTLLDLVPDFANSVREPRDLLCVVAVTKI